MGDDLNTDVSGSVTPPAQPAAQTVTPTPSDTGGATKGLETRVHGLTAEKGRLTEQLGDLQRRYDELADKYKTDSERAIEQARRDAVEQFKKSEFEPVTTKATAYEARLDAQIASMKANIPDGTLPEDFDSKDTVYKFDFLRALTAQQGHQPTQPVGQPVNPQGPQAKRVVPGTEFRAWQNTNMYNPEQKAEYEAKKAEMMEAHREGRIDFSK